MSRGYDEGDCESNIGFLWGSIVDRAAKGERGQKLLSDLCAALDAMPVKELITGELVATGATTAKEGAFCTLGALGHARGVDMRGIDAHDYDGIARTFGCAYSLAREIMAENDDGGPTLETPAERWARMRTWVARRIVLEGAPS